MGFFSRKPKVSVENFCQDIYNNFFECKIRGIDLANKFFEIAFDTIVKAAPDFASVDRNLFNQEITSLRMELFAVAWMNYIGFNRKLDDYCLRQTAFSKKYLESIGRIDIWDIMQFYNTCISDSGVGIFTQERALRAYIVFTNKMRMDLFDLLMKKKDYEPNCIARVLNRYLVEESWKQHVTLKYLVALCAKRLGYDISPSSEGLTNLSFLIYGLYDVAMNTIKSKAESVKVTL